jgi:hypothetical protein
MYHSQTWQQALRKKEVEKNSYRFTDNIKKAKAFAKILNNFTFCSDFKEFGEQIIFSRDLLDVPLLTHIFLQPYKYALVQI